MGIYVANQVIKLMIKKGYKVDGARVLVMGITFKENCPDIRNSRVIDVVRELQEFGCEVDVYDPWADPSEVKREYGLGLITEPEISQYNAIVLAVAHKEFANMDLENRKNAILYDIKSIAKDSDGRL
jgi:UDP-N-acetyl-D-galactosamine dehydrogenase